VKNPIFALVIFALGLVLLVGQASAQATWIYGSVMSAPVQVTYGTATFYSFSFTATSSGETLPSNSLTCVWMSDPVNGQTYNFTGQIVVDSSSGVPLGFFLVTGVNSNSGSNSSGIVHTIWSGLVFLGASLAGLIVQALANGGYSLTPLIAGILLLLGLGTVFSFLGKIFPWYVDLAGAVVFLAISAFVLSQTGFSF
jgi:hypothetical protein